tara:strand:- start:91 stop:642 length:552 start_codon:yes stop_codon:yes gene_type:complete
MAPSIFYGQYFSTTIDTITTGQKNQLGIIETLTSSVVVDTPGKSSEELYKSVENFIQINYVNPENVAKGSIEGKYYRFSGSTSIPVCVRMLGMSECTPTSFRYTFEVKFKDNRFKIELIKWEVFSTTWVNATKAWYTYSFNKRKGYVLSKEGKDNIDAYVNKLNDVVSGIVNQIYLPEEDDDW